MKEGISPEQGGLRLGVQGGGCSGLSYNIRFDTQPRERDRIFQFGDVRVFVDPKSFIYLHGMTLDYQETLMQQGFVFVNPNASKSCGCGTSFSADGLDRVRGRPRPRGPRVACAMILRRCNASGLVARSLAASDLLRSI